LTGSELSQPNVGQAESSDLDVVLAALHRDYSKLGPRIRELQHEVTCECAGATLRLHFPAFRQGKTTIHELVELAWLHLTPFALTRKEIDAVKALQSTLPFDDFLIKTTQLNDTAAKLFIKAHKATNRNGEAGELLLYLLTEWILGAPQFIAKMTLKTNSQMPVHGADGVHVRYCPETARLFLYWGESKMYGDVGAAINAAATSIAKSLEPDELGHELQLVQRNIDFTGLGADGKAALLRYLDPHEEEYNERKDVITCLIGFDFDGFQKASAAGDQAAEDTFRALAKEKLAAVAPKVAAAFQTAGLDSQDVELFFFPLPTVQEFRDLFQARIGWLP
jgi:Cap4 SAVED domain